MPIACWIPEATNTHSEYVILPAFPLQQWLHERVSMLLYVHYLSFNDLSGSVGKNYNMNGLNEVLCILHCITAKPAFMFGLEVWFVRGRNNKKFSTHGNYIPEVNCWVYTDVKRSYSHSAVANVVKNFMIHRTQWRSHVVRIEDNIVLASNAVEDLGGGE